MLKTIVAILIVVAAVYICFGALLYVFQRSQQYFPAGSIALPAHLALRGVVEVRIDTEDGETIAAWYGKASEGMPTFLYLPGNGGSISDSHDRFADVMQDGFGFLAVSYRGYPGSTGSPSEAGLASDGTAAFDWLVRQGVPGSDIVLYGWSLGSGVAAHVAARRKVRALVFEAPFVSAEAIARTLYPHYPVSLLMKDKFRTDLLLPKIDAPMVVLHGTADMVVPVQHGRDLVAAYAGRKTYLELLGGNHIDLWEQGAWPRIRSALRELEVAP